jgi:hypothetical protein
VSRGTVDHVALWLRCVVSGAAGGGFAGRNQCRDGSGRPDLDSNCAEFVVSVAETMLDRPDGGLQQGARAMRRRFRLTAALHAAL